MENIYTVAIALITGITGTTGWQYFQRRLELKKEEQYSYKYECRSRIDKLEDELNKAEQENKQLSQKILELSVLIAQLTTRIDLMEKGVGTQHTGL
jgi:predicted negative regulator of RcsB-dependent stress response